MRIVFIGNKPTQNIYKVGVMGNNETDYIKMIVTKEQGDIDLSEYTPYLKIVNSDLTFANMTNNLEVTEEEDTLQLVYRVPIEVTTQGSVDMQLSFEEIILGEEDETYTLVWQSTIFHINFDKSIDVVSYAEKYEMDVITDMLERIKKLEETSLKQPVVEYESVDDFPNIGLSEVIYVDKSENTLYRFDETNNVYYVVGEPNDAIKKIICNANDKED